MKLCRFDEGRYGEVFEDRVFDITRFIPACSATSDPLIAALPDLALIDPAQRRSGRYHLLPDVRLLAPVGSPGKIVAAPVNYLDHVAEANADPAVVHGHTESDIGRAGLFLKANSSLAGPANILRLRFPERRTDYEVELVAVIGAGGSDIGVDRALAHVAGYAVGLDITLRGPEDRSFRKSIDGYSIVGPWLTTSDEIADPANLALSLHLNGEPRQAANTAQMVYGVAKLVAFASSFYTLHPGDLLFSGTPAGVGPIVGGDRIEASIEGLGTMVVNVAN